MKRNLRPCSLFTPDSGHDLDAALEHDLSQGSIESTNTKIRLITRIAFGFRFPEALIALAMLALGGHRPALPGPTKHPWISQ
ncbi:hypothetical protein ACT16_23250 [Mycobacterium heckeshornense]|nr:hypothetical protein ACT16_23250 [Mycobacterium heckeshornense]